MTQEEVAILVVDDVASIRTQIKDLLRSFGFRRIKMEESVTHAKIAMDAEKFDLVLCDWHMQPLDGLELLKYVRSSEKFKDIAFVMVTAEGTKDKVMEALKCGVDDYLLKPLTIAQIQTKVYGTLLKRNII